MAAIGHLLAIFSRCSALLLFSSLFFSAFCPPPCTIHSPLSALRTPLRPNH